MIYSRVDINKYERMELITTKNFGSAHLRRIGGIFLVSSKLMGRLNKANAVRSSRVRWFRTVKKRAAKLFTSHYPKGINWQALFSENKVLQIFFKFAKFNSPKSNAHKNLFLKVLIF